MTKQNLFEYLDAYDFAEEIEIQMAIADWFSENLGIFAPSFGELMEMGRLAEEYKNKRNLIFNS